MAEDKSLKNQPTQCVTGRIWTGAEYRVLTNTNDKIDDGMTIDLRPIAWISRAANMNLSRSPCNQWLSSKWKRSKTLSQLQDTWHDMNAKWRSRKICTLHEVEICPRINYTPLSQLLISILQMAATRWLLLAACIVSPCAWCTLTSGPRLSYFKSMHHAAKASFKMFISIWPWVFKQYSNLQFTLTKQVNCCYHVAILSAVWYFRDLLLECFVPSGDVPTTIYLLLFLSTDSQESRRNRGQLDLFGKLVKRLTPLTH